jgi:hypothetical protein
MGVIEKYEKTTITLVQSNLLQTNGFGVKEFKQYIITFKAIFITSD